MNNPSAAASANLSTLSMRNRGDSTDDQLTRSSGIAFPTSSHAAHLLSSDSTATNNLPTFTSKDAYPTGAGTDTNHASTLDCAVATTPNNTVVTSAPGVTNPGPVAEATERAKNSSFSMPASSISVS